ncbi:winged helix-turn-helix domain-containing protein [Polaribacter sp. KT 15]|uniref:GntR family transcriptional regulator n=1 Tax=Polaribacter sp. KT 15 TaxID=1896175 RepID=UPI00090A2D4A|nr:winged helix-turn-helix domain-containing protein [Polaribacter sp. KT 15]SHM96507.1 transcriptional regulator, GntR family [Polaribacter sp. KT 15]
MSLVTLNKKSKVPKYKQIIASIEDAVQNGTFKKGDKLPSINSLRDTYKLSRDTVLMAFNELKNRGIIHSVVGKGYYLSSENVSVSQKIFLLFDEFNAFKEDLYNSFLSNLDANIKVDIYFHHFNPKIFNALILDNIGDYNHYIIMPANIENTELVLENLPKEKVFILDQLNPELKAYSAIFQNFEKNIFTGLNEVKDKLANYIKLIFVYDKKIQPKAMLDGFESFCEKEKFENEVIDTLTTRKIEKGEVYIIPEDKNLIQIIKKIKETYLILKKDIGIVCYNDTMLKEIVEGGITTISTDFTAMGKNLASIITTKEKVQIENPSKIIVRNSL